MSTLNIIHLNAGCGGVIDGFSHEQEKSQYRLRLAVEKNDAARKTLKMRVFLSLFENGYPDEYYAYFNNKTKAEPDWSNLYPKYWQQAESIVPEQISLETMRHQDWRNNAKTLLIFTKTDTSKDQDIQDAIEMIEPDLFWIFEPFCNTKTSFDNHHDSFSILRDKLSHENPDYTIKPLMHHAKDAEKFTIHTQDYGVPQYKRILMMIGSKDKKMCHIDPMKRFQKNPSTIHDILSGLPQLRGGISNDDTCHEWKSLVLNACDMLNAHYTSTQNLAGLTLVSKVRQETKRDKIMARNQSCASKLSKNAPQYLMDFITNPNITNIRDHHTRIYAEKNIPLYLFMSIEANLNHASPLVYQIPQFLTSPETRKSQWRVHAAFMPAMEVECSVLDNGRSYIHPDPKQCRSMTIRELARIQTFADDYLFYGNDHDKMSMIIKDIPPLFIQAISRMIA